MHCMCVIMTVLNVNGVQDLKGVFVGQVDVRHQQANECEKNVSDYVTTHYVTYSATYD